MNLICNTDNEYFSSYLHFLDLFNHRRFLLFRNKSSQKYISVYDTELYQMIRSMENRLMKIEIRVYKRNFIVAKSSFVKICSILCQL